MGVFPQTEPTVTDDFIEEVYIMAVNAKNNGQDFIPVHVFPVRFGNSRSIF